MSWERPDVDEYSRGYIHVAITFEVTSVIVETSQRR